jgi:hypothetical protein
VNWRFALAAELLLLPATYWLMTQTAGVSVFVPRVAWIALVGGGALMAARASLALAVLAGRSRAEAKLGITVWATFLIIWSWLTPSGYIDDLQKVADRVRASRNEARQRRDAITHGAGQIERAGDGGTSMLRRGPVIHFSGATRDEPSYEQVDAGAEWDAGDEGDAALYGEPSDAGVLKPVKKKAVKKKRRAGSPY